MDDNYVYLPLPMQSFLRRTNCIQLFFLLLASSLQYSLHVITIRRNSINTKRWFITQKLCVGNEKGDLEVVISDCCWL